MQAQLTMIFTVHSSHKTRIKELYLCFAMIRVRIGKVKILKAFEISIQYHTVQYIVYSCHISLNLQCLTLFYLGTLHMNFAITFYNNYAL